MREHPGAGSAAEDDLAHHGPDIRRLFDFSAGLLGNILLHLRRRLVEHRQEQKRQLVAKAENGAREVHLAVHLNDARGQAVPRCRRLRAQLLVHGDRIAAPDEVMDRHAAPRIDTDDLVERHRGIPERLQVAPARRGFPPAAPLQIVVDDVHLAILAEAGGEEILRDEDAQHVGDVAEKLFELVLGYIEDVGNGCDMSIIDVELPLHPLVPHRPPEQVLGRLVETGSAHGHSWRVGLTVSSVWRRLR